MSQCCRRLVVLCVVGALAPLAGCDRGPEIELVYRVGRDLDGGYPVREVREILAKRLKAYGARGASVRVQDEQHLVVRLPARDPALLRQLRDIIENVGHLEFRLVADTASETYVAWENLGKTEDPPRYTTYVVRPMTGDGAGGDKILVADEPVMTGAYIKATRVVRGGESLYPSVGLSFTPSGEIRLATLTGENVGRRLAIILNTRRDPDGVITEKGTCHSAPVIRSRVLGDVEIRGDFSMDEAKALRTVLMAGSLPGPLELVRQTPVAP